MVNPGETVAKGIKADGMGFVQTVETPEGKTISSYARKKTPSIFRSGLGKEAMAFPENGVNGIRE